ncbi:MAG TPA: hypothetical protein VNF07_10680 [Acidimicrobiales bacterium]|nr:hypothetical protein [Acidimicrobiales bacterium]
MPKFEVLLEFEANDENGTNPVAITAVSVSAGTEWVLFYSGFRDEATEVVAAFPKSRVVSVIREDA